MPDENRCFICLSDCPIERRFPHAPNRASCPVCGEYEFHDSPANFEFRDVYKKDSVLRLALSHRVRQLTLQEEWPLVTDEMLRATRDDPTLPPVADQTNNVIRFLGSNQDSEGRGIRLPLRQWVAIIGTKDDAGARFIIQALEQNGLLTRQAPLASPCSAWSSMAGTVTRS